MLTDVLDYELTVSMAYLKRSIKLERISREQTLRRQISRCRIWTHRFHLEDMVRGRAFASMAIWAAAVGCAITLLTRSFGHLSLQMAQIET